MAMTNTKKQEQLKAQRLEAVYQSMSNERREAIEKRIRSIPPERGVLNVARGIDRLVAKGYTEDELEAVLKNCDAGSFYSPVSGIARDVWTGSWLLRRAKMRRESILVPKGENR